MFEDIARLPVGVLCFIFFIYGSFFGSFANVLIYRMQKPGPLNLLKTSYCPHCLYSIPFYLNIPILSWFILRGSCSNCLKPISFRYPFVEFLMAFLFSALFLAIGWKYFLIEALLFTSTLIVASFIDWDQMILPDSLTLTGIVIGLLGAWINPERSFFSALLGSFFGGGLLLSIAYSYTLIRKKEGLGGGDIKMMAWIGAVLAWPSLFFVLLCSCLLGSLVGLGMMLHGNKNFLKVKIPFGPYLALSSLIYIFLKETAPSVLEFFMPFYSL